MSMRFLLIPVLMMALFSSCSPALNSKKSRFQHTSQLTHMQRPGTHQLAPLKGPLIVIDAGHGGNDLGANSSKELVYEEKHLALSTAHMVERYLREKGYPTLMTRRDDTFIPLLERSAIANEKGASLFVSVHYNSAPAHLAHGIEVFYYEDKVNAMRSTASKEFAEIVLDQVILTTRAKSRGVKHGNLAVVRETAMPAILIEGGFLTNKEELSRINNLVYRQRLASGIAEGIGKFVQERMAKN